MIPFPRTSDGWSMTAALSKYSLCGWIGLVIYIYIYIYSYLAFNVLEHMYHYFFSFLLLHKNRIKKKLAGKGSVWRLRTDKMQIERLVARVSENTVAIKHLGDMVKELLLLQKGEKC